jgi:4a-hydroxytetrahydrobiopterin dehydratase
MARKNSEVVLSVPRTVRSDGNRKTMRHPKLMDTEISVHMTDLPGWAMVDNALVRTYTFPDFVNAMVFVNEVARRAEAIQHHPDIDIRYNKVTIRLTTHDSGGITSLDFGLAQEMEAEAPDEGGISDQSSQ